MRPQHHHVNAFYVIALTLALTLYAGCAGGASGGSEQVNDYRFGSQALELRFHSTNPTVFRSGDTLTLLVDVYNRGTSDVTDGDLYLTGFDPTILENMLIDPPFLVKEGKDEFDPRGEFSDVYTIHGFVNGPRNSDEIAQTIQLTSCYEYSTIATAEVCVDSDPFNRKIEDKVCQLQARNFGAQGHPLVVSGVEPTVSGSDIRFKITVSNSDSGTLFDPAVSNDQCAFGLDYGDIDKIYVGSVSLSNKALFCEPVNPVRLRNGQGTVVCQCENCVDEFQNAYWAQLNMEFHYGYKNTVTTGITVYND
ncbi:MAG: hypothetical protein ACI8Y7_000312 [Candidatus Woesearchaeota archaeon]|jgi:hypothetical protein